MGDIICKKYGRVPDDYCIKCDSPTKIKGINEHSDCPEFVMLGGTADRMGWIRRESVRDSEGNEDQDVMVVDDAEAEMISKIEDNRKEFEFVSRGRKLPPETMTKVVAPLKKRGNGF